jgi:hypothetical protein
MQSPLLPTAEQSCKNCRYRRSATETLSSGNWDVVANAPHTFQLDVNRCHENTPHLTAPHWPEIQLLDWCGKWAPAEGL